MRAGKEGGSAGIHNGRQQAYSYQDTSPAAAGIHTRAQHSHRRTHSSNLPHSSASPSSRTAATTSPPLGNSHESNFARGSQGSVPATDAGSSTTRPPPSSPPISPTHVGTTPLAHFVAPSHYLRPPLRPPTRPASSREDSYTSTDSQHMTATDREQIEGLVSDCLPAIVSSRTCTHSHSASHLFGTQMHYFALLECRLRIRNSCAAV
jgi:hypothetical protein